MGTSEMNLLAGWLGMLGGVLSGAITGLFFHRDEWMGGYGSYRRRLLRLGHISFFGLGIVNLFYGLTLSSLQFSIAHSEAASIAFIIGLITMPCCCFLAAWKKPLRHFFPIPVVSVMAGLIILLLGWHR